MGLEIQVNSTEEMCDNKIPVQRECWWIFTFCGDHEHAGKYVKIYGTYGSARQKMFDKYSNKWGFQYSEYEWELMKKDPNRYWDMETELEVIE